MFKRLRVHPETSVFVAYFLLTLLCFFPLVNGSASLNWDASDLWLPWKHFIVEELYNGQLPLWNPYHVNGFPQHGDSMTWYPVSWLFGFINGRYNLSALNQEYLFHIFIAALGFYRFSGNFLRSRKLRFLLGLSYMFSGFMIGNAQHVSWIISAAWFPWVFHYLVAVLKQENRQALFKLALCSFLFFSGGYLALFFVALYILVFTVLVHFYRLADRSRIRKITWQLLAAFGITFLLCLPLLLSAWEIFPLFNRFTPEAARGGINIHTGSTPLNGVLSIFLPLASGIYNVKEISFGSFSAYLGLVPVLLLIIYGRSLFRLRKTAFSAGIALFFLLCSLGDLLPLRDLLAKLPLLDLFRYPTLFRLFFIFFLLLAAGLVLDHKLAEEKDFSRKEKWLFSLSLLLLSAGIFIGFGNKFDFTGLAYYFRHLGDLRPLETLQLYNRVFLNLALVIPVLLTILLVSGRKWQQLLLFTWGLEILAVGISSAPHTVYHPVNVAFANGSLDYQPQNYPPLHHRHKEQEVRSWNDYLDFAWQGKTIYLKQWSKHWYNPLKIKNTAEKRYLPPVPDSIPNKLPAVSLIRFSGKSFSFRPVSCEIKSSQHFRFHLDQKDTAYSYLLVKQRFVPEWQAFSNGNKTPVLSSREGFVLVPLKEAGEKIDLRYDASSYRLAFIVSCTVLLFLLLLLLFHTERKTITLAGTTALLLLFFVNSASRFTPKKTGKQDLQASRIGANELNRPEQFLSLRYWKQMKDQLLLVQNYPKTEADIAYFRYFYPESVKNVLYRNKRYTLYKKTARKQKLIYSLQNRQLSGNFVLHLDTLLNKKKPVIGIRLVYRAKSAGTLSLWLSQIRGEQWIAGKAFPTGSQTLSDTEDKIIVRYLDLSTYHLLPEDELKIYFWGDDPKEKIQVKSLEIFTD